MSRQWFWGSVIVLLLCALALLGLSRLRWETHTVDMGYTDKARREPYLAARQFLEKQGIQVHAEPGLTILDKTPGSPGFPKRSDALVLLDAYGMLSPARSRHLLQWVSQGGQLIMSAENPFIQVTGLTRDPVFQALGVRLNEKSLKSDKQDKKTAQQEPPPSASDAKEQPWPSNQPAEQCSHLPPPIHFHFNGDLHSIDIAVPGKLRLVVPKDADAALLGNSGGIRFAQFNLGKGQVTLLSSARLWGNRYVGCYDHAYMLWQLTTDNTLWWLTNEKGPSLWRYLWSVAALMLVAFACWLAAFFWRRGTRFGPLWQSRDSHRRRLTEHLDASARFLWRTRHGARLLEALRRDVIDSGKRHRVDFARLPAEERWIFLAGMTGLEASVVADAMQARANDQERFTHIVGTLQAIRNRL